MSQRKRGVSEAASEAVRRPPAVVWMLPSLVTLMAICAGLTAIRFAMEERFGAAVLAICLAGLLDGLDGRIARRLGVCSRFGAHLDNLADVLSFGAAPAIILYLWGLQSLGGAGWCAALIYVLCCALRLARFLAEAETAPVAARPSRFFRGLASPAGAAAALLPISASLALQPEQPLPAALAALWLIGVGALMVSTIPSFGLKRLRLAGPWLPVAACAAAALAAAFLAAPFATLAAATALYLASLPVSLILAERARLRRER